MIFLAIAPAIRPKMAQERIPMASPPCALNVVRAVLT
jgi:hypothetical protein